MRSAAGAAPLAFWVDAGVWSPRRGVWNIPAPERLSKKTQLEEGRTGLEEVGHIVRNPLETRGETKRVESHPWKSS